MEKEKTIKLYSVSCGLYAEDSLFAPFANVSGDYGTATAGDWGTATAGNGGKATAGYEGTAIAGEKGIVQITYESGGRWRLLTGYIGEDGLEPNTPYKVRNGKFVKA